MTKYEFEYCKCGQKLLFEEEYDTCTSCSKRKKLMEGKMPSMGNIFLYKPREYDDN